jgi:hypothetical protein
LEDHSDDPPKFDALLALNDNRFYGLPEIERIKVLYTVDPLFRQMMPKERWKVVTFLVMGT